MSDINHEIMKVMETEMVAISKMIHLANGQYDQVFKLLLNCKGKVIFMGIGKSGHIGKKLAATFSSTGTPSFFIHASEAVHGDFGMIEEKDTVILISNSGSTKEIVEALPFLDQIGCIKIGMTSGLDSTLAKGCDYMLGFPKLSEADHLNLAPTVSSTLTLVLGDALACALSKERGFSKEDFYRNHPGGALGAALSTHAENESMMNEKSPDVLVVGSFVTDMVSRVHRFPEAGETLLSEEYEIYLGGKGINQCVSLSRLGVQVEMAGMLGKDEYGRRFIDLMRTEGIFHNKVLTTEKAPTASAQIQINDAAENKIVVNPSSNYEYSIKDLENIKDSIKNYKLVVSQLELKLEVVYKLIKMCNQEGVPILLNPAPATKLPVEILNKIDYLTPNEIELSILTDMPVNTIEDAKKAAISLLETGVKNIIVTLGNKGALMVNHESIELIDGYNHIEVVDTVGAGDSFNGALSKCIIENRTLSEGVRFANAMGALTVTKHGAIPSLHNLSQVLAFIQEHGQ